MILQEYSQQYDMPCIINRCGVIAGPWQLGKVDQGVFTYWLAQHVFGGTLKYIGFIKTLFGLKYNDITNAFKCYRRDVINGLQPLLSHHFNLTVELPLKAIVRGYNYTVVPISWTNRDVDVSKLKLKEMGSRYLFICLYVFLEKLLSKGDYHRIAHAKRQAQTVKATEETQPLTL